MNSKAVIGLVLLGLTFAFSNASHAQFKIDVKGNVKYSMTSFKSQAQAWTTFGGAEAKVEWMAVYMEHPKCPDYPNQNQEKKDSSVVITEWSTSAAGTVCNSPVRIWACAIDKVKTGGKKICSNDFTIEAIAQ